MSRAPRQRLRPVAPFAAALLVVLGLFAPATGGAPLRVVRTPGLPARSAAFAPITGAVTLTASRAWHRHSSHLAIARPGRIYPGLPREFRPLPPAHLGPVPVLLVVLLMIGTVATIGRRPRRILAVALPRVRAPPALAA